MSIYHFHHIVPRHMGGGNERSNLVKLTVEEHAEAHRVLYDEHGKHEDYIAWKALSGQMTMDEAKIAARKLGSEKGRAKARTLPNIGGASLRDQQKGIHDPNKRHLKQKGGRNAVKLLQEKVRGTKWMTNGTDDKRAAPEKQEQLLNEGWTFGRTFSPNKGKSSPLKGRKWFIDENGKRTR